MYRQKRTESFVFIRHKKDYQMISVIIMKMITTFIIGYLNHVDKNNNNLKKSSLIIIVCFLVVFVFKQRSFIFGVFHQVVQSQTVSSSRRIHPQPSNADF